MNPELEKTIDSLLSNGDLSDRSRELLMKKAEQHGVDLLDFELELEKKIAQKKASTSVPLPIYTSTSPQSNKEGSVKKCPACGAPIQSFSINCSECGHEFRNSEAVSSITKLFALLDNISKENANEDYEIVVDQNASYMKRLEQQQNAEARIEKLAKNRANRQMEIIRGFPVPNAKEDILEFLSQAFPKAKPRSFWSNNTNFENEFQACWKTKCEEIIIKARFSMKEDKLTLEQIENYAKQLKIK